MSVRELVVEANFDCTHAGMQLQVDRPTASCPHPPRGLARRKGIVRLRQAGTARHPLPATST